MRAAGRTTLASRGRGQGPAAARVSPSPIEAMTRRCASLSRLSSLRAVSHSGNVPLEEIYKIARTMRPRSLPKKFEGTVLEILGTAQSVGCTVEGEDPHDLIDQIHDGELKVPDE